jgi:hypothetical protein
MLGNVVIGLTILGPAGMLSELAAGLGVGIHDTGLLVTYGAVILCVGSPIMAWLTTHIDRRALLVGTLALLAAGQAASALAPDYAVILALRLVMLAVAAVYTPQAAATVALIVPVIQRPSAIAFVFLGWSLAIAGGLPVVTLLATHFGWRFAFAALAALAAIIAALLFAALPAGLQGKPLSLASFATIARNRRIVLILLVTLLQTSGQFTVFISRAAARKPCRRRSRHRQRILRALWHRRAVRQCDRERGGDAARHAEDARAVHDLDAARHGAVGVRVRLAAGDRRRHILLGTRLCRHQLDAAGAARGSGARSRQRLDRTQHLDPLHRPGDRLRHRRLSVRGQLPARHGLYRRRFRRFSLGAGGGDLGAAAAGCGQRALSRAISASICGNMRSITMA